MNAFWNSHKSNEAAVKSKIQELRLKNKETPLFKWLNSAKGNTTKNTETDVEAIAGPSRTQPNLESDTSKLTLKSSDETAEVTKSNPESVGSKHSDEATEVKGKYTKSQATC